MAGSLRRATFKALLCLWPAAFIVPAYATAAFPALDRPALAVRFPDRVALEAAATAGRRVVAVGERGVVVLSDDDGMHWRQAKSVPVGVTLTAVCFVDASVGWAVGHGGVILKTGDGGETWRRQIDGRQLAQIELSAAERQGRTAPESRPAQSALNRARQLVADGPDKPLLDVWFTDASHGYVVGAYGLFFETRDAGLTWTSAMDRLYNPKALHLYAIRQSGSSILIVGEQGALHRSLDGGNAFDRLDSPYKGSLFTLTMLSAVRVVIAGLRGNAFYSANGGSSWSRIEGAAPISFVSSAKLNDGSIVLVSQAGQLLASRAGEPLTRLDVPALPPLSGVLPLHDGEFLGVGLAGAMRIEASVPQSLKRRQP